MRGSGLVEGLLGALHLMEKDAPGWMEHKQECAAAVNRTLTTLADEYLDTYVSFVLGTACEHHNVYKDFGGSEVSCKPVFQDLGARFDGNKDYTAWCTDTMSLLGGAAGGATSSTAKGAKVAKAAQELKRLKEKHAKGEDINKDLGALRKQLDEADKDAELARSLEKRNAAGSVGVLPMSADTATRGGDGSTMGGSSTREPNAKDIRQGKKGPFPYVKPFGSEGPAQTLTEDAVGESNAMVDQIERAQAAEEKRATYRALTHLRHTTVASFDGIAHRHMQNIHEYGKTHSWREQHPIRHLAQEEGDVGAWAFPSSTA